LIRTRSGAERGITDWAAVSNDAGETVSAPLAVSTADSPAPQPLLPFGIGDDVSLLALSRTHAFKGWADDRPGLRQGVHQRRPPLGVREVIGVPTVAGR
jgi:hypothetical protein